MLTPLDRAICSYEDAYLTALTTKRGKDRMVAIAWLAQVVEASLDEDVLWRTGVRVDYDPQINGDRMTLHGLLAEWFEGKDEHAPSEEQSYATRWRLGRYEPNMVR